MSDVSEWLSKTRRAKKLSQAALASQLGVSQAQISQWERGKMEPKPEQLELLKDALGEGGSSPPPATGADAFKSNGTSKAILGFEEKMWAAADKLRGSMDASEYKHVVLGLIFLKYVSDAFEQRRQELLDEQKSDAGVDPEDRDEYEGASVFWVPESARWPALQEAAKSPDIGVLVDKAMEAIENIVASLESVTSRQELLSNA